MLDEDDSITKSKKLTVEREREQESVITAYQTFVYQQFLFTSLGPFSAPSQPRFIQSKP